MKLFQGIVLKTTDKTIAVEVARKWVHPKYQKIVKSTKKYLVHDAQNIAKAGETVSFKETRPISKRKRFILITGKKIAKN